MGIIVRELKELYDWILDLLDEGNDSRPYISDSSGGDHDIGSESEEEEYIPDTFQGEPHSPNSLVLESIGDKEKSPTEVHTRDDQMAQENDGSSVPQHHEAVCVDWGKMDGLLMYVMRG
ncbi:hypothetical protein L1887_11987 [Cichorium endivia]|nr:hypothetical protein L1887_11987 [Cichorium endivia]